MRRRKRFSRNRRPLSPWLVVRPRPSEPRLTASPVYVCQSWASTSTYSYSSTVLVVLVLILVLEEPVLVLYSYSRGVYSSIRIKNIIIHTDTSIIVAVALSLLVLFQSLNHAVLSEPDDFLRKKSGQPNLLFFKKASISFSLWAWLQILVSYGNIGTDRKSVFV